uniref:DUF401 family protein n=1 Tax=candidate division WOR-3 bacterium TaxID=2052148 RepID=A0A7C4UDM2_UNCW3
MAIVKLSLVILFLIVLISRKIDLWIALFICSIITAFFFGVKLQDFFKVFFFTIKDWSTISIILIIFFVLFLSSLLESGESLEVLKNSVNKIVTNKTFQLVLPSALIGLLPMPGGALLGAPLVKSTAKGTNLDGAKLTFINYWFRHIWEYFWPLYPGLILTSTLCKIPLKELSRNQFIFTPLAISTGLYVLIKFNIPKERTKRDLKYIFPLLFSISPIILIVLLFAVFKIDIVISVAISTTLTLIFLLIRKKVNIKSALKEVNYKAIIVIFFILFFKNILNSSGGLKELSLSLSGVPKIYVFILLFYLLPLMTGFLTGVNQAYVAVSFPLFIPFLKGLPEQTILNTVGIAYISGFAGVLLSPTHLCLVLTKEYFKARFIDVYKLLLFPVIIMMIGALILGIFTFPYF